VSAAAILLVLVAGLLGVAVYRIATDKGELVIQTDSEDVEVVVSRGGEVVTIIDTKSGKRVTLKSGDYELALKDGPEGLRLSPDKVTLKRGETVLATITRVRFIYLNLQPQANVGLDATDNSLAELPKGEQDFAGVKFNIGEKLIQVGGSKGEGKPEKVEGIKVGMTCRRFHFLHACHGSARKGATIGEYTVTYDDKSQQTIRIVYGEDIAGWWFREGDPLPNRARIAWAGTNAKAAREGCSIRLYLATWENPKPTRKVVSIDFVRSPNATTTAPFCVAITAEK
jgi:hypothetical protein